MTAQLDFVEFVITVQSGSLSRAAAFLGVSKSHVSKRVSALERRLGVQLLVRTTRKLSLTDVGQAYFERCERILEDVNEAESIVSEIKSEPQGVLNISLPNTLGERHIVPLIAEFMSQHRALKANVSISTRTVDLLDEGFDLAVRLGTVAESRLVARKLASTRFIVCATPRYLSQSGTPATPAELCQYNSVVFDRYGIHNQAYWILSNRYTHRSERFPVQAVYSSNNADSLITCALQHIGLLYLPELFVRKHIQQGQLVRVLDDWGLPTDISAVYPYSRHLSIKVRRFVDFLRDRVDF